jgi:hypothetical protein
VATMIGFGGWSAWVVAALNDRTVRVWEREQLLRSLLSARTKEVEKVSRSRLGWQTNKPPLLGA